jgi:hypothetical protein
LLQEYRLVTRYEPYYKSYHACIYNDQCYGHACICTVTSTMLVTNTQTLNTQPDVSPPPTAATKREKLVTHTEPRPPHTTAESQTGPAWTPRRAARASTPGSGQLRPPAAADVCRRTCVLKGCTHPSIISCNRGTYRGTNQGAYQGAYRACIGACIRARIRVCIRACIRARIVAHRAAYRSLSQRFEV